MFGKVGMRPVMFVLAVHKCSCSCCVCFLIAGSVPQYEMQDFKCCGSILNCAATGVMEVCLELACCK